MLTSVVTTDLSMYNLLLVLLLCGVHHCYCCATLFKDDFMLTGSCTMGPGFSLPFMELLKLLLIQKNKAVPATLGSHKDVYACYCKLKNHCQSCRGFGTQFGHERGGIFELLVARESGPSDQ